MSGLLRDIKQPSDLRDLTREQLVELAAEIRQRILHTVSCTGGHLAPNLGVVELTIAIHRSCESPRDKIIWDVGHQCYAHKLLTGREDVFDQIRQDGGPSGFPKRNESEHDVWGAGHGSTSISAALGFATARDLRQGEERVVAIIGDGALTGGMAFEALNQAGQQQKDMLVVLNDNEMSIGRNVGAVAAYLSRVRAGVEPTVRRARRDMQRLLRHMPGGDAMMLVADRVREGMKQLVVAGMLFEQLGFTYLGPIDGHDMDQLLGMIEQAKRLPGPVLLHVLTTKGKGYDPAECNPEAFHGTRPFDLDNGHAEPREGPPTYSQVFGDALCELAERDRRIVAVSAAMLAGTGLRRFKELYPDRCFDVGMAEEHAVTYAAAMAAAGLRPVVAIYSTFMQRAYDQVLHDVCLQGLPVVLALDRAGLVGDDGPTHHGVFDLSFLRNIPGLTIMAPSDEAELRHMLLTALRMRAPVAMRYPRGQGVGADITGQMEVLPQARGRVVRQGQALTILSIGTMLSSALAAADILAREGTDAAVVDARYAKPLDEELILQRAALGPLLTVEENVLTGGFGAGVLELLQQHDVCTARVRRLGIGDRFIGHGARARLWAEQGLDVEGIVAAVRSLLVSA